MGLHPRHPHEMAHRDWTVLLCHPSGAIAGDDGCGLYHHDCRLLSRHQLTVDGEAPESVSSAAREDGRWIASSRVPVPGRRPDGPDLPQDAIEVRIERSVGGGMVERLVVQNHSMVERSLRLRLVLGADFADTLEVAQQRRQQHGDAEATVDENGGAIEYRANRDGAVTTRGIRIRTLQGQLGTHATGAELELTAKAELRARGMWSAVLAYEPLETGGWRRPDALDQPRLATLQADSWERKRAHVRSSSPTLQVAWQRAARDLHGLRNRELEPESATGWVVNAGVPIFTGLFGRDVLTTGWQAAMAGPDFMRGALEATARLQATVDDPWLDAEPGKLIHELRRGPLADLGITAQRGYYGTQTTAAMFPLVLSELWHWTGDDDILQRHRPTAERALEWARRYGDLDGDGFLEYRQRSPVGIKNQAWKDSHEAIRHADGSQVPNPIAAVEEQAFHYLALVRMAEMCVALADDAAAERYLDRARRLRGAWHEAYWMPDEGFYAMALDPEKRQVTSIGSNAGHALAAGMVPVEHARAVADRLMAPDLFSGWGVRTLSDRHPAFNAWAYHLGTVWPVENATFALGFKRYGLDEHVDRLAISLLEAARGLPGLRLPELIGGQAREQTPFPVAYPDANCPQAWSASATIQLLQIMLGIYPFAPMKLLALVRPRLPAGIDEVIVHNLRVGSARISIRFRRRPDGTAAAHVLRRTGTLLMVHGAPPDAEGWNLSERLAHEAVTRAPGRRMRALRLALGAA